MSRPQLKSRRRLGLGLSLAAFALAAVPTLLTSQTAHAGCKDYDPSKFKSSRVVPNSTLDTQKFHDMIVEAMGDDYMGYVVILKDDKGKTIMRIEYGLARTPCAPEGEKRFTRTTKTFWGSGGSKMTTFVSALHRIEHASGKAKPGPKFNLAFQNYLPKRWRSSLHAGYKPVDIEMIMQHRAGFQHTAPPNPNGSGKKPMYDRLRDAPEREVGKRKYANSSASIFQWFPLFWAPAKAIAFEKANSRKPIDQYNEAVQAKGVELYADYVTSRVLEPLGIKASCHDIDAFGSNWARYYKAPGTTDKGHKEPHKDKCAAGGWVMTPAEMAKFVYTFAETNTLLSSGTRSKMQQTNDDRLGWSGKGQVNDGPVFHHGGSNGFGAKSMLMHFKGSGFTAVAITNTKKSAGWQNKLMDAYNASLKRTLKAK